MEPRPHSATCFEVSPTASYFFNMRIVFPYTNRLQFGEPAPHCWALSSCVKFSSSKLIGHVIFASIVCAHHWAVFWGYISRREITESKGCTFLRLSMHIAKWPSRRFLSIFDSHSMVVLVFFPPWMSLCSQTCKLDRRRCRLVVTTC